ncbi:MAG: hypothetical protein ABR912_11470 [Terracidiphilus sp.]|jgi:hypothetical protein
MKRKASPQNDGQATRAKIYGMSRGFLNYVRPYYRADESGHQRLRYVLWLDTMGSHGKMLRNVWTASIPVMKLHVAALVAQKKTLEPIS